MTPGTRLALYAGLALGALLLWRGYQAHLRDDGAWREYAAALQGRIAYLERESARTDTVYRDSVVVRTKVERVTDSILRVDTLLRADTVRRIVADERAACDAVVRTCEARVALRDQRIAVLDSLLTVERKRRLGFIRRTFGCTAGVAATTSGAGLGASCGIKFP